MTRHDRIIPVQRLQPWLVVQLFFAHVVVDSRHEDPRELIEFVPRLEEEMDLSLEGMVEDLSRE